MNVDAALDLFASVPKIRKIMRPCTTSASATSRSASPPPTLSGGEAQRVKLAAELARPDTGKTLYILDEPTTGLHLDDVRKLLGVVHRLADLGNTVVIIEHNLEVIKTADWIIDIGPEAGRRRRLDRRRRPSRVDRQGQRLAHRRDPQRHPRRRPVRGEAPVRPQGRRQEIIAEAKAAKKKPGPKLKPPGKIRWATLAH